MANRTKEFVGTVTLGERVRVTDPCYNMDTWCAGSIDNVLPGTYRAYVQYSDEGEWGERVSAIILKHTGYSSKGATAHVDFVVGVDSGTCGIFDEQFFKDNHNNEDFTSEAWKLTIIETPNPEYLPFKDFAPELFTEANKGKVDTAKYDARYKEYLHSPQRYRSFEEFAGGVYEGKALVGSSGYGDGAYDCYTGRNADGKVVVIRVQFI